MSRKIIIGLCILSLVLLTGCTEETAEVSQKHMQKCFDAGFDKYVPVSCELGEIMCLNATSDEIRCV